MYTYADCKVAEERIDNTRMNKHTHTYMPTYLHTDTHNPTHRTYYYR